jgi:uncharacterized MnhB-related membrane protein
MVKPTGFVFTDGVTETIHLIVFLIALLLSLSCIVTPNDLKNIISAV